MRHTFLLTLGMVTLSGGCEMFKPAATEPVVPPPLQVKAAVPVSPDEVTRANAPSMAQRLSEEMKRDGNGENNP
jgi:hypothetical protein